MLKFQFHNKGARSILTRTTIFLMAFLGPLPAHSKAGSPLGTKHPVLDTYSHPLLERYPFIPVLCGWDPDEADLSSEERLEDRTLECYRRLLDPTYQEDLRAAVRSGEDLIQQGLAAIEGRDFERARALLATVGSKNNDRFQVYSGVFAVFGPDLLPLKRPYRAIVEAQEKGLLSPPLQGADLDSLFSSGRRAGFFHLFPEENQLWNQEIRVRQDLSPLWHFRTEEKALEQEGALSTHYNGLERAAEVLAFHAFDMPLRRRGMVRRPSPIGDARFVKGIEFDGATLTLRIRTRDCYELDYSAGTLSLAHPIESLDDFRYFSAILFGETRWHRLSTSPFELFKQFDQVKEVFVELYFPGKESGSEKVIAQFGLPRTRFDQDRWSKLTSRDGSFQDHLKTFGTYWLHPEMPDMAAPSRTGSPR